MTNHPFRLRMWLSIALVVVCSFMSVGGTVAWFTDTVSVDSNIVATGTLEVSMAWAKGTDDPDSASWQDASAGAIFDYDRWEPGYAEARHVRIGNEGQLALTYQLFMTPTGTPGTLANVIDVYFFPSARQVSRADLAASTPVGTLRDVIDGTVTIGTGMLVPGQDGDATIVLKMQESAGNEYQGARLGSGFSVRLVATQAPYELDSFGTDYDASAITAISGRFTASVSLAGKVDGNGYTTEALTIGAGSGIYAEVPAGVKVEPGASELVLDLSLTERSSAIQMVDDEVSLSFDVHIHGVSSGNDRPITIHMGNVLPAGLKDSSVSLFHVEGSTPRSMTMSDSLSRHNQFSYNSATGAVTLSMATFSEVTAVVAVTDPWNGTEDTSWYNDAASVFYLSTPEQLAGLGALVAEGNTFEGKTIMLTADVDLGGEGHPVFYPIGYRYHAGDSEDTAHPFKGTFDGQGHRISDLYQNTWNIQGHYSGSYYNNSLGLFALIEGGTVRNVTLENFILEGEYAPTGCVAGAASGGTYESITLRRCKPATYNTGVGGLIGWDCGQSAYTFRDINIGSSNTVIALWSSWDVGCAGILGHLAADSTASMTDCIVAAKLDVYNDVCGNYQYYQYRYAGMLIGSIGKGSVPVSANLTCSNVKVYLGHWHEYYYCEFEKNSSASYTEDFQFSRVEEHDIVFDLNGNIISCSHTHTPNEDRLACHLPFSQLYTGYGWGASPVFAHDGVEVIEYVYDVIYLEGSNVIGIDYVTDNRSAHRLASAGTGYNWVNIEGEEVTSIPAGTTATTVVYKNNKTVHYARFVDINGMLVYEEQFDPNNPVITGNPQPPSIPGYIGSWEPDYMKKLQGATADVIIHPIYTVSSSDVILGETNINNVFDKLSDGETAVLGSNLQGSAGNASKSILATITTNATDKDSELVLSGHQFTYVFSSNANKNWTMFQINSDSKLTISSGLEGSGTVTFNLTTINGNAKPCIFDIQPNGTLVLERGVTIELQYPSRMKESQITPFKGITDITDTGKYPGLHIENDTVNRIYRIIVTGTTTLVGNQ